MPIILRDYVNKLVFNVYINAFRYVYNVKSVRTIAVMLLICLKISVYCTKILRLS